MEKVSQEIEMANALMIKEKRAIEDLNGKRGSLESQLENVMRDINNHITNIAKYEADIRDIEKAREIVMKIAEKDAEQDKLRRMEGVSPQ
jgi:flagellin-like hook-associated protein FlgL